MKTYQFLIVLLIMVFSQLPGQAQQGVLKLDANYQVAFPMGKFKSISDEVSGRGWSANLLYGVSDQFSIGFSTGMQDFYKKFPRQVYHEPGSDVSAVITNSVQTVPLLLKGKYRFESNNSIQPFAAFGVGGNLIHYRKYYGQFADNATKFGFAAQPELGLRIAIGRAKNSDLHLGAGFNFMPTKFSDLNGTHHAFVNAGLNIPLR